MYKNISDKFYAFLLIFLAVLLSSCGGEQEVEIPFVIRNDTYSLYFVDPEPWEAVDLEESSTREFCILQYNGIEISCGKVPTIIMPEGSVRQGVADFATDSILNDLWLPGVDRWMLDTGEIEVEDKWFYFVTLLARRDPGHSAQLTQIQLVTHAREIRRFPNSVDMIVRLYLTYKDDELYMFTLSGLPEDVAAGETQIRNLLGGITFTPPVFGQMSTAESGDDEAVETEEELPSEYD